MKCPNGHDVTDGSRFCNICGVPIPQFTVCPNGHQNPVGSSFCTTCGSPIGAPANQRPVHAVPSAQTVPFAQATPAAMATPSAPAAKPAKAPSKKTKRILLGSMAFGGFLMVYFLLCLGSYSTRYSSYSFGNDICYTEDRVFEIIGQRMYGYDGASESYIRSQCEQKYKTKVGIYFALSTMLVGGLGAWYYMLNKKRKEE